MLVFWKAQLVFLANSRTGATSLETALESLSNLAIQRPEALKQTNMAGFRTHLAPWLEAAAGVKFETVSLIREPVDWLGSWYRDRLRDRHEGGPAPEADPLTERFQQIFDRASADGGIHSGSGTAEDCSFAQFAEGFLQQPDLPVQSDFLGTAGGDAEAAIDHLFRYEDIPALVAFLEDRLDCVLTLPRLRSSPHAPLDLSDELRGRLETRLAADRRLYEAARRRSS